MNALSLFGLYRRKCPKTKVRSKSGRCVKRCRKNQVRSRLTGRCVKRKLGPSLKSVAHVAFLKKAHQALLAKYGVNVTVKGVQVTRTPYTKVVKRLPPWARTFRGVPGKNRMEKLARVRLTLDSCKKLGVSLFKKPVGRRSAQKFKAFSTLKSQCRVFFSPHRKTVPGAYQTMRAALRRRRGGRHEPLGGRTGGLPRPTGPRGFPGGGLPAPGGRGGGGGGGGPGLGAARAAADAARTAACIRGMCALQYTHRGQTFRGVNNNRNFRQWAVQGGHPDHGGDAGFFGQMSQCNDAGNYCADTVPAFGPPAFGVRRHKRCRNGYRRGADGRCHKTTHKGMKRRTARRAYTKKKRCPNGYRRNPRTGRCQRVHHRRRVSSPLRARMIGPSLCGGRPLAQCLSHPQCGWRKGTGCVHKSGTHQGVSYQGPVGSLGFGAMRSGFGIHRKKKCKKNQRRNRLTGRCRKTTHKGMKRRTARRAYVRKPRSYSGRGGAGLCVGHKKAVCQGHPQCHWRKRIGCALRSGSHSAGKVYAGPVGSMGFGYRRFI